MAGLTEWSRYDSRAILGDWTVPLMAGGATIQSPATGTKNYGGGPSSTISVTTNSIVTTALPDGMGADVTELEITPPQLASGTQPDCVIWFTNGSTALDGLQYIDASLQANMFPRAKLTRGQRRVTLGHSLRNALRQGMQNLPLKVTGIKVTQNLILNVASIAGWSNPAVPLRVVARGAVYDGDDLMALGRLGYNGSFSVSGKGVGTVSGIHQPGGTPGSIGWFASLPGGTGQKGTKINRRIAFAYNALDTTAATPYTLSDQSAVLGTATSVSSPANDLGVAFSNARDALILTDVGFNLYNAGSQAYVGWRIDRTVVPQDNPYGTYVTQGNNDLQYGSTGAGDGQFFTLVPARTLGPGLIAGVSAVPIVTSANAAVLPAGSFSFALAGVQILQA